MRICSKIALLACFVIAVVGFSFDASSESSSENSSDSMAKFETETREILLVF